MTIAAAQTAHFFDEILKHGFVWTIRDDGGFPAPENGSGERAMPFWSLESRVRKVITNVAAYREFTPHRLTVQEFTDRWLLGLERDGIVVGMNWSGDRATGYDLEPAEVRTRLKDVVS